MKRFYTVIIFMVIFSNWLNLASAQNVEFPDVNLANKVREALNLPAGAAIPKAQLATLTSLYAAAQGIHDITGLEHATQLTELDLRYQEIIDISPLAGLTNLTRLELRGNKIIDISPLAGLTNLTRLDLGRNNITDISPLAGLTNLTSLWLGGNPITDASPLDDFLRRNPDAHTGIEIQTGIKVLVQSVSFSPDSTLLVYGTSNAKIRLIDVATKRDIAILEGHTDVVRSVSFSPDGRLIASGSSDGTVMLWDVETHESISTINTGTDVASVLFSPDGLLFAIATSNGIELWNVETKEDIATLPTGAVRSVSFSPDGSLLACGGGERLSGAVTLWNVETKENIAELKRHPTAVVSVSFSPDGSLLASTSFGGGSGIMLWDVETKENIATLHGESISLTSIAFSPDGTLLASGSEDFIGSKIELWDVSTREHIATLQGHTDNINSVSFSPDGKLLASGSSDGTVKFWDVAESTLKLAKVSGDDQQGTFGSELSEPLIIEVKDRFDNPLQGIEVTFTVTAGDGKLSGQFTVEDVKTDTNGRAARTLALGQAAVNTVEVSIAVAGSQLVTFSAMGISADRGVTFEGLSDSYGGISAAFSPDSSLLATGTNEGTVKLWNMATKSHIATFEEEANLVLSVSFSPDGSLLASAANAGNVNLWDVATKEKIATLEGVSPTFSPDGSLLAIEIPHSLFLFDSDPPDAGTVKLWDVATKAHIATFQPHGTLLTDISFSPDSSLLVFESWDSGVELWDVAKKEHITTFEVLSASFSPDSSLLAIGTLEGSVKLWDVATKKYIATLQGHIDVVTSVSFSPDGRLLASGSTDGTIMLWDVATKEKIATLEGHQGSYTEVMFSPNGTLLLSVAPDAEDSYRILSLWDVAKKEKLSTLSMNAFTSVLFSPDGSFLVAIELLTDVSLWNVAAYVAQLEPAKIAEDVNGDGVVNTQDLLLVIGYFGKTGQHIADVNMDEVVDVKDLIQVAGVFGNAAAAPSPDPQLLAMFTAADVQQWLSEAQHLNLTDITSQRGIRFLEQLLAALIPKETALLPNYPNPFNPETWIPYQLANDTDVQISIYDINGALVRQLDLGHQRAGYYTDRSRTAYWDGRNAVGESVASGLYFYQLQTDDVSTLRKMVIVK